ncbi:MAG: PTS fructose transporter subunit IIA [Pseudomonadota bacterium]
MLGIVIVTHGNLGEALLQTAEYITADRLGGIVTVSIGPKDDSDNIRRQILSGIKKVEQGSGVLILTDMFGGTPSNLSYSFLKEGHVEVLSGVNLPMIIKAFGIRKETNLSQAAVAIETHGKKSISLASGLLKAKPKG